MRRVNQQGINEIRQFLAHNHKLGGDHFSPSMLDAWAADAEFQEGEGNGPRIEIVSHDSTSGATVTYTISDAGMRSVVYLDGREYDEAAVVALMDDEIRERLHAERAPCAPQEFLDAYVVEHEAKFGAQFAVA